MNSSTPHEVFTKELLSWYQIYHRELPWRDTKDPYKIWLSEIILQQTRVSQGLPYYQRFVAAYPRVEDLAQAPLQHVMRLWQGLGYYSRAKNLHKCALMVMQQHEGRFPRAYQDLLKLPGIGDYTASAIASFAYSQAEPVVDGNVFRVISRVFGITSDITKPAVRKEFKQAARELMPATAPDTFNQAIMEFGALQCTPKKPGCRECPFGETCHALNHNLVNDLPVKSKKTKTRDRFFNYFLVRYQDQLLMKERTAKDIWQGLFDFLLLEQDTSYEPMASLEQHLPGADFMSKATVSEPSPVYRHKLSHQHIHARFTEIELLHERQVQAWKEVFDLQQFEVEEVQKLPKPILIDNYLKAVIF
ncbi:MAG: A/G-specific adenine glycosylase [Cyclobacteriaceae bacterium]|nr:A/G-specific adenine glycosylase [Cyclobacteriaceae bacterium]